MILRAESGAPSPPAGADPVTAGVQAGASVGQLLLSVFDIFDVTGKRKEAKGLSAQAHETAKLQAQAAAAYAAIEAKKAREREQIMIYAAAALTVGGAAWFLLK